jgi:hypothetical protein
MQSMLPENQEMAGRKTPIDETPRFAIGFAVLAIPVAIVLTFFGVRMKDFTLLFVIAWVLTCGSVWIFCRWIGWRWLRWLIRLAVAPVAIAWAIYGIDRAFPATEAKTVTIVWDNPAPINTDTPLSEVQLDAKAMDNGRPVNGDFIYDPTFRTTLSGGTQTLHVKFKPKDSSLYLENEKTVAIVVRGVKHNPPPTPPSPPNVQYGPKDVPRLLILGPIKSPRIGTCPDAYKDFTDSQLADLTIKEANKIGLMASDTEDHMFQIDDAGRRPMADIHDLAERRQIERDRFSSDFLGCCEQVVKGLREELFCRMPDAKAQGEADVWRNLFEMHDNKFFQSVGARIDISYADVDRYSYYMRRLAMHLQNKSSLRDINKSIAFTQELKKGTGPESSDVLTVSISSKESISAGYLLIEFDGVQDLRHIWTLSSGRFQTYGDDVDNRVLSEYMKARSHNPPCVIEIGDVEISSKSPLKIWIAGAGTVRANAVVPPSVTRAERKTSVINIFAAIHFH